MEQRQPVFHADMAAALADRLIERVLGNLPAKMGAIARAEAFDPLFIEPEFADRENLEGIQLAGRPLADRIEGANGFQLVAKEIEPQRLFRAGREDIDNPAAHRIFPGLPDRRRAGVTICLEKAGDILNRLVISRLQGEADIGEKAAWRNTLQQRVHGCQHHGAIGKPR